MIEIVEVKTKKQQKQFVLYQLELYKDNPYFVPPIIADEMTIFDKNKNANYEDCETIYFLAYKEGKIVGRIAGILQKASNAKMDQKNVRFSRVDFINNIEVARALFNAVENWAKSLGMNAVHGPLGFNDLEREGLLIEGFDEMSCFEENYNYAYYKDIIEQLGYEKDVDWLEYLFPIADKVDERAARLSVLLKKKYNLRTVDIKSTRKILKRYKDQIFALINECYAPLYGVVPITKRLEEQLLSQFKLIINYRFISLVVDSEDNLIGLGLVVPSIAKAIKAMKGRLLSPKIFMLLKAIRKPDLVDTAFIAVTEKYRNKGITAFIFNEIWSNMIKLNIRQAESLLQLESNITIRNQFTSFNGRQHKRRRCFIKKLSK